MNIISAIIYSYTCMIPYWNNRELSKVNTWIKDRNIRKEVYKNFEGKVLDMCCGTGFSTKPGNIGIDTSLDMLRFSKIFNPGNDYRYGNAERFGKDDEFDTVSIMFAFHEMPTDAHEKIIRNAIRVARKKVVIVDLSKDYEPTNAMLSGGEPYLLNYLKNFEKTVQRTPFHLPLSYKTRTKLDGVNKTNLIEGHIDMWEYTMGNYNKESEEKFLEDTKPDSYPMYRLGGNGGWGKFGTLEDKKTDREEKKEKEMADRRMKKAARKLNYKRMKSIEWENREEEKLDNWEKMSGIYILRGDGNYENTPHPLQREREENERLNEERKNSENTTCENTTCDYNYWGTITTNMIDENKRRVDDYSYKNKALKVMKTNWYYSPSEES